MQGNSDIGARLCRGEGAGVNTHGGANVGIFGGTTRNFLLLPVIC